MKIFISWSKNKSRLLAAETKRFLENTLGNSVEYFFSPEMYKGTRVDHEIHENLLHSNKCIVCITSENYKNPWLLYEAGVVFGANYSKTNGGIVIPLLFEPIPDWSSWVDKPLNQYVPIQLQASNGEFSCGRQNFKEFLGEIAKENNLSLKSFSKNWKAYETAIKEILKSEQLIPDTCRYLIDQILEKDDGIFSIVSPEITKNRVVFHRGFATTTLTKILLDTVVEYQGKRLWFYGRRNKRLLTSENDWFFKFLSDEGLDNGVDFRCLFPYPGTDATIMATSKEKERSFLTDLHTCLEKAIRLKKRYQLPIENMFRLYRSRRTDSIIVSDNALLHRSIVCDGDGYPLPYTNSEFEIMGISENETATSKSNVYVDNFIKVWENSVPLTEELYHSLYPDS